MEHWKTSFAKAVDKVNGTSYADARREKIMIERQRHIRDAHKILASPSNYSTSQVTWAKRFLTYKK